MRRIQWVVVAALLTACGGSQKSAPGSMAPDSSVEGSPAPAAPPEEAGPTTEAEKAVIDQAVVLSDQACACTDKACADRHVGKLFGFVLAQRGRKAGKAARTQIGDLVAKQVKCAEARLVSRSVIGRILLIAATTAKDWAEEVQKMRDASCDCKNSSCSATVLAAYVEMVALLKKVRVTKDEAERASHAGQTLLNCMKSLGLPQSTITSAMRGRS